MKITETSAIVHRYKSLVNHFPKYNHKEGGGGRQVIAQIAFVCELMSARTP